jgi:hypothetical protein
MSALADIIVQDARPLEVSQNLPLVRQEAIDEIRDVLFDVNCQIFGLWWLDHDHPIRQAAHPPLNRSGVYPHNISLSNPQNYFSLSVSVTRRQWRVLI